MNHHKTYRMVGLDYVAMMGKVIEEGGGHFGIAEYLGPLRDALFLEPGIERMDIREARQLLPAVTCPPPSFPPAGIRAGPLCCA